MSGSRSETTPATVCGRCAAMEPTEGCACCTCAWAFGWLMDPLFRADPVPGASETARGTDRVTGCPFLPVLPRGGVGCGAAGSMGPRVPSPSEPAVTETGRPGQREGDPRGAAGAGHGG